MMIIKKMWWTVELLLFFIKEIVVANIEVARLVIGPVEMITPAIVCVPLDMKSETGRVILANMCTLTPGTLSLELTSQKLFLHVLDTSREGDDVVFDVKDGYERRLMRLFGEREMR